MNSGALGLFAVGDANPIVSGSAGRMLSIVGAESFRKTVHSIDANGTHGTTSRYANRRRGGNIDVGGSFAINPVALDLAYLLPKCLGTAPSGTTFALSDAVLPFVIQKRTSATGNRVFTYPTNYVNRATFSASAGEPLLLAIDAVGLTEDAPASTWPSLALPTDTDMFVMSDLSLSLAGSTVAVKSFSVTVDNALIPQRVNSRTVTAWSKGDRKVGVSLTLAESDAVYTDYVDVDVPVVLTFSYNSQSLVLSMGAVRFDPESPAIAGRGAENDLTLTGMAGRTASVLELVATCDSTP